MKVKLHYKTLDGKAKVTNNTLTIKEATKYFNKYLKDDKNITKVYLSRFTGWRDIIVKILKKEK